MHEQKKLKNLSNQKAAALSGIFKRREVGHLNWVCRFQWNLLKGLLRALISSLYDSRNLVQTSTSPRMIVHSADGHEGTHARAHFACASYKCIHWLLLMQRRRRSSASVIFSKMWESLWEGKKLLAAAPSHSPALKREPRAQFAAGRR